MINSTITILSADHNELVQLGIRYKLEQLDLFTFTFYMVSTGQEAIEFLRVQKVDVFLMDLHLEKCDGFSVLTIMQNLNLQIPTIIVSDIDRVSVIKQALNLGAKAFVHKNQDSNLLGVAILSVLSGQLFYSERTKETLEFKGKQGARKSKMKLEFTEKELLILSYLLDGLTSKEIAYHLFLSPRTIESHRARLMRKTETKSMLELAKYVAKNKLKLIGKG